MPICTSWSSGCIVADDYPSKKNDHPNVLLVDPQKQLRRHLQELITDSCGCNAVSAATASGALMRMDRQPFDLVLTDLSLPDADGKWLIEKIRRRPIAALVLQRRRQNPFTTQETKLLAHLISPLANSIDLALRLESKNSYQTPNPRKDLE